MAATIDRIPSGNFAEVLLKLENLSLAIGGNLILEHVDLEIRRNEFVCVVGPSGCGKTSLLRLTGGLFSPTQGKLTYGERRLSGPLREIAIVFQDYTNALLPWRTASGNVSLALESLGVPRGDRQQKITELLELVGLAHCPDHFPSQLSGGMQQRLQIARCLAQDPEILLMDEPFGSLDAMARHRLQDEIQKIAAARGTSVCFVTHDLEEAIYLADRVVALRANPGRIGAIFEVSLPRPRHQLQTREHPEFLRLRRELFRFIEHRDS